MALPEHLDAGWPVAATWHAPGRMKMDAQPKPAVSVLLPVRNAASMVARAVQSILDSDFQDWELVVVDDASTDDTVRVLDRFRDRRLRRIHRPRHDFVGALNQGVAACRAPLIARMDADDVCHPTRLGCQLRFLQNSDLAGVGGKVRVRDRHGRPVPSWRRYETWLNQHRDAASIAAFRFVESPLANPTVMVRREVLELGYLEGDFPEDYDLWLRAMARGYRFAKLNQTVLDWVDHPSRITRRHPRYSREAFDRCRQRHLLEGPLRGVTAVDFWGAGSTGKPWLRWLPSQSITVRRVIEVSPRRVGEVIHGAPVRSPGHMPAAEGVPLLIAVGAEGARDRILEHLRPLGYLPGRDAWFLA